MGKEGRTVIIGIDGVPFELMRDLSDENVMPHFKELREEGQFAQMGSSIPEISSVSWNSIVTGKNPGEHGVYGFTDMIKGTYSISFFNSNKLRTPPFWKENDGKTFAILNVPSTYPAQELSGVLVSGFVSPDLERAVYPSSYLERLKRMNYRVDIDSEKGHKSKLLLFKELFETLETRMKAYRYFWGEIDWDVFMTVFTGSDRLEHFLWNAYEDSEHEYHSRFLEFFSKIDEAIGEMAGKLKDEDSLIILSDHGMEGIKTNVNLNTYMVREGFLKLGSSPNKRFNNIKYGSKAFALNPGRIYLNKEGKFPRGCVKAGEEREIIDDLKESLNYLEWNGEKVIDKIYEKEDIYRGNFVEEAPDLVLMANSGFNLMSGLSKEEVFEEGPLTGKHTQDDAFLFVRSGAEDVVPERPCVEDVVPIMNKLGNGGHPN